MDRLRQLNLRFKPLRKAVRTSRRQLPELNFITIHYMYFTLTTLISAVIFWGAATPFRSISFIDSLFLTVSAMSLAGLNTVNLSTLNTFQQVILFLLIMLGSAIFVSAFVVYFRQQAFNGRLPLSRTLTRQSLSRGRQETTVAGPAPGSGVGGNAEFKDEINEEMSIAQTSTDKAANDMGQQQPMSLARAPDQQRQDRITFSEPKRSRSPTESLEPGFIHRALNFSGVGARPSSRVRSRTLTMQSSQRTSQDFTRTLSAEPKPEGVLSRFVSRNSEFHHLTEVERLHLVEKEHKAVSFLAWVVPLYFVAWQLLGCLSLGAYVNQYYASTARDNGLDPWWVGAFNAVSAFNNSGMSLLDANMVAFNKAVYMLLSMSLFILAGNTCYPIFLRLIVWAIYKLVPQRQKAWEDFRHTLKFLLDHPRRCYTNLFPSEHTWWLFSSVVLLNAIDCAAYLVLNIGNDAITRYSPGIEFIDGLFQATAVRSGGFYVVPISSVRISLQVLYVIMMYISAFPITITMRNSNVYEERSLGIYSDDPGYDAFEKEVGTVISWFKKRFAPATTAPNKRYFVQQQLRAQLAHDIWWLVLAVFFIMIIEGSQFQRDPVTFSVFNVIFEVVSGYGTVGISVGLPNQAYSFCGAWHTLSKLILCAVMLRGRHRGLPVAIDKAVLLPGDQTHALEEEDADIRAERSRAETSHTGPSPA